MTVLLIETSTERGVISLFKDNSLIYLGELPFNFQNSKVIFTEIEKAFQKVSMTPKDLGAIVAGVGPGSYTGIRVGAMTAKTLSFALQIPLIGVCSLEGFIPQKLILEKPISFASIIDAKIGGVYLQMGQFDETGVSNLSDPNLYSLEEAVLLLKEISILVTPNAKILKQKFDKLNPENRWEWVERYPDAVQMIRSGCEKFEKGEYSQDFKLDLLYLRKTQAEIERGF